MRKYLFQFNSLALFTLMFYAFSCNGQVVHKVVLSAPAPAAQTGVTLTGYNIYRTTTSGQYNATPYASVTTSGALNYTDNTVTNGVTYFYRATALVTCLPANPCTSNESAPTNEAQAIIPPNPTPQVPNSPGALTVIVQ